MSQPTPGRIGLAFGICILAGLSTSIGAALPLIKKIRRSDRRYLSIALAISGGVMIFVSMCEILQVKAIDDFKTYWGCESEAKASEEVCKLAGKKAISTAYSLFFCGILICAFFELIIHRFTGGLEHNIGDLDSFFEGNNRKNDNKSSVESSGVDSSGNNKEKNIQEDNLEYNASQIEVVCEDNANEAQNDENNNYKPETTHPKVNESNYIQNAQYHQSKEAILEKTKMKEMVMLQQISWTTQLALIIHNIPEGLATFVTTVNEPISGIGLAIAIAIHNIPEGLAVSTPYYYRNESRQKAFFQGSITGCAEQIGGLLAYFAFASGNMNPAVSAVLFSIVSGMMTHITFSQLLPSAYVYDKRGHIVPIFFTIGMFIMALSLVLFNVI